MASSPDRWLIRRAALAELGRSAAARARRLVRGPRRLRFPDRLVLAPQELRTADPSVADEMADGIYVFGDARLALGRGSPLAQSPPSRDWAQELLGFGWLRHLRAAGSPEAAALARGLVAEWVERRRREPDHAAGLDPRVTARRVISFLAHSPFLLGETDHAFYRNYLRSIGRDVFALQTALRAAPLPGDRLSAALGLCFAGLCCTGLERPFRSANRALASELAAQIGPDGTHLSRNPGATLDLLLDLLPLRLLYSGRAVDLPGEIDSAVDRAMPMLRHLRHGCGDLALFNGMGQTSIGELATVLFQDATSTRPSYRPPESGYQRLEAGDSIVIVDCGAPPPVPASAGAHAGCLSFELSSGLRRIVVNCGSPEHDADARQAARLTAAHSTLTVGDASSATILSLSGEHGPAASYLAGRLGPVLLGGPAEVGIERTGASDGEQILTARHDGYRARFGATHVRTLRLTADGAELHGRDELLLAGSGGVGSGARLRFHLHPSVRAEREPEGASILLRLPGGGLWRFMALDGEARLERSIFLAVSEGRRATQQIVVDLPRGSGDAAPACRWLFRRDLSEPAHDPDLDRQV